MWCACRSSSTTRTFPPDSIAKLFASHMPWFIHQEGQAILSRFPIVGHRYVRFPGSGNDYLQADVKIGGDTVRIFSVHLQTSGISSLRHRFRKDHDRDVPVERVIGELERNSRIRAQQVREIRTVIDSTRYPVIVARGLQRHTLVLYLPPVERRHDRRVPGCRRPAKPEPGPGAGPGGSAGRG